MNRSESAIGVARIAARNFLTALALLAAGASGAGDASLTLTPSGGSAAPGGVVALPVCLGETDAEPDTLVLKLAFDTTVLTVLDGTIGTANTGKLFTWRQTESGLAAVFLGGGVPLQAGVVATFFLEVASTAPSAAVAVSEAGSSASSATATAIPLAVSAAQVTVAPLASPHTADTSANGRGELTELMRAIQLYNAGGFGCDSGTEDGYLPGGESRECPPHDLDFANQDWLIDLGEILRAIQFYNAPLRAYHADATGEDGYAPGLAAIPEAP